MKPPLVSCRVGDTCVVGDFGIRVKPADIVSRLRFYLFISHEAFRNLLTRIPKFKALFCGLKGRRITAQGKGACAVALGCGIKTYSRPVRGKALWHSGMRPFAAV